MLSARVTDLAQSGDRLREAARATRRHLAGADWSVPRLPGDGSLEMGARPCGEGEGLCVYVVR